MFIQGKNDSTMKKLITLFLLPICLILSCISYAGVDGFDYYSTSNWVEFDEYCFSEGDNIYMFDWETSDWHIVDIEDIACYSSGCEIEIYDYTFSSYRYIELEEDLC